MAATNDLPALLHIELISAPNIISNGYTPNRFTIGVFNNQISDPVVLDATVSLHFWFIISDEPAGQTPRRPWGLTSRDLLAEANAYIGDHDANWIVEAPDPDLAKHMKGRPDLGGWRATPKDPVSLQPGQSINFTVDNLVSDLPDGYTTPYFCVLTSDFPKVTNRNWFSLGGPILKTPIVVMQQNVGIGTDNPNTNFQVTSPNSTNVVVETTGGQNAWAKYYLGYTGQKWAIGTSRQWHDDMLYIAKEDTPNEGDASLRLAISTDGKVGIGNGFSVVPSSSRLSLQHLKDNNLHIASDLTLDQDEINLIKFGNSGNFHFLHKAQGHFDRKTLVLHADQADALGFYSTNWTPLLEVEGGTGRTYIKGDIQTDGALSVNGGINTSSSLSVEGALNARGGLNVSDGDVNIDVNNINMGTSPGQRINLWGTGLGIGVQQFGCYIRTDAWFNIYQGGKHSTVVADPGKDGKRLLSINPNGDLALGGNEPQGNAKLEVFGVGTYDYDVPNTAPGYQLLQPGKHYSGDGERNVGKLSILTDGTIAAPLVVGWSDGRIKQVTGISDAGQDLSTLLQLKVSDYTMRDVIQNGTKPHKKLIAQEVKEVFPQAVSQITGVVPDIYQPATVKDGWIILATDLKAGEKVRIISTEKTQLLEVLEVEADRFRVSEAPAEGGVFVYGREVGDFHMLDYEAISMLNVSATQELHRQMELLQEKVRNLELAQEKLRQQMAGFGQVVKQAEA